LLKKEVFVSGQLSCPEMSIISLSDVCQRGIHLFGIHLIQRATILLNCWRAIRDRGLTREEEPLWLSILPLWLDNLVSLTRDKKVLGLP